MYTVTDLLGDLVHKLYLLTSYNNYESVSIFVEKAPLTRYTISPAPAKYTLRRNPDNDAALKTPLVLSSLNDFIHLGLMQESSYDDSQSESQSGSQSGSEEGNGENQQEPPLP